MPSNNLKELKITKQKDGSYRATRTWEDGNGESGIFDELFEAVSFCLYFYDSFFEKCLEAMDEK